MAIKVINIPGVGEVTLIKRSQNRSLRLSVTPTRIRVSMPTWTSFSAGAAFAASHALWIQAERMKQARPVLENGQRIGKLHYLHFEQVLNNRSITSRVTGTEVIVRMQLGETSTDPSVQKRAVAACVRALKREAERLLPPRLANLAKQHQLSYSGVQIKALKRRWGSCDNRKMITLNLYLMELPWIYIDYVLLHELTHTVNMDHSPDFWTMLTRLDPEARTVSKRLRKHQPGLGNWLP